MKVQNRTYSPKFEARPSQGAYKAISHGVSRMVENNSSLLPHTKKLLSDIYQHGADLTIHGGIVNDGKRGCLRVYNKHGMIEHENNNKFDKSAGFYSLDSDEAFYNSILKLKNTVLAYVNKKSLQAYLTTKTKNADEIVKELMGEPIKL